MASTMIMLILMVVVMWFFFIRPQSKRQKELNTFRASLGAGSKVITAGGIHGTIKEIADNYVMVEIAPSVKVKIDKAQVFPAGNVNEADLKQ